MDPGGGVPGTDHSGGRVARRLHHSGGRVARRLHHSGGRVARRRHAYRDPAFVVASVVVTLALSACSSVAAPKPTATPAPTAATLNISSLTLTPAGVGAVSVGAPIPTNDLVKYGPNLCAPGPGWITLSPKSTDNSSGQPLDPFDVLTDDHSQTKAVTTVFVWSKQIATPEGIRVGSSQAEVVAAYPSAKQFSSYATRVYAVRGTTGTLVIEVASHNDFAKGEWPASELGTVVWMFTIEAGAKPKSIAGDNAAGPCPGSDEDPGDVDDDDD